MIMTQPAKHYQGGTETAFEEACFASQAGINNSISTVSEQLPIMVAIYRTGLHLSLIKVHRCATRA